jgi:hypothetical protein
MVRRQDRRAERVLRDGQAPLAQLAGDAVVAAATASWWETTRHKLARLLGHGDPVKTNLMEQRLTETREQLLGATGANLESASATLAAQWATWLTDLLTKDPVIRPGLLALVQQIHMALGAVAPADNAALASQDININAGRERFDREAIPKDVVPPGPISPGLATS